MSGLCGLLLSGAVAGCVCVGYSSPPPLHRLPTVFAGLFACRLSRFWRRCKLTIDSPLLSCHKHRHIHRTLPQPLSQSRTSDSRVSRMLLLPWRHLPGDTKDLVQGMGSSGPCAARLLNLRRRWRRRPHNIARIPVPQIASGIKGFPLYSALVYEILILPTLQSGDHLNNLLYLFWLWHKAFPFVFRLPWFLPQPPVSGHSTEEKTQASSQHKCFRAIQKKKIKP